MHNVWPCAIVVLSLTGTCIPSVCADLSLDDSEAKTVTIMSSKWGQTIGEFEREVVIDSDRLVDLGEYGVISVLNLPARIDENSVRVKDIIGAEVLGTSFSTTVVSRKDDPSFQEAERAVQKQLNDLTVTLASHQLELNRLQSIPGILDNYLRNLATPVQSSGEVLPSSVSVSGLVDAIDGLGALTKQNIKEQSTVSRIIDETKECITATKARLQQLQNNGRLVPCTCSCSTSQGTAENGDTDAEADDTSAEARVQQWPSQISFKNLQLHVRFGDTVASQPRSKVKFLITYQCSGVSWSPEYDVKLNEESIDVYGFASVVQYTGSFAFLQRHERITIILFVCTLVTSPCFLCGPQARIGVIPNCFCRQRARASSWILPQCTPKLFNFVTQSTERSIVASLQWRLAHRG